MADVQCVTCGQAGEAITDMLFLGKLEAEIKAKVCKPLLEEVGRDAGHGDQRVSSQFG